MKGVGIDIVEVKRFRKIPYKKNGAFYSKIFSDAEIKYCLGKDDPYQSFAARFAAKEAVLKCLKSTIYKIRDVEIKNDKAGAPVANVKSQKSKIKLLVSLSHVKEYAIAIALWLN